MVERIIHRGLEEEIAKIIEEETIVAKEKVAARVADLKQNAIGRILSKFRVTQVQNPECWSYILKFEI